MESAQVLVSRLISLEQSVEIECAKKDQVIHLESISQWFTSCLGIIQKDWGE